MCTYNCIAIVILHFHINFSFCLPVACHDIDQWPCPVPGDTLNLPIMGTVIQVSVCVYVIMCHSSWV